MKTAMAINTTYKVLRRLFPLSKSAVSVWGLPSTFTMIEKTWNCFTPVLRNAGVAVTFTCVTVFVAASDWDVRINRQEVDCIVLRKTWDGSTFPFNEDWFVSTYWPKKKNNNKERKRNVWRDICMVDREMSCRLKKWLIIVFRHFAMGTVIVLEKVLL